MNRSESPPEPRATYPQRSSPSALAMLGALSLHLMRAQTRSALVWGTVLGLMSALVVAMFPSVGEGMDLNAYLANIPREMIALFGIESVSGLNTIEGWLGVQLFNLWLPLSLSFYPILIGANAIAGAEERGRLDMLLSNPLPRWQLIASTAIAMLYGLLASLAVLWLLTYGAAAVMGLELSAGAAAAGVFNLLPMTLFFGALALLFSATLRRAASATALCGALLVAMYLVDALAEFTAALASVRPLSLFQYYGSAIEEGISWPSFAAVTLLALALAASAVVAFNRRDIYT